MPSLQRKGGRPKVRRKGLILHFVFSRLPLVPWGHLLLSRNKSKQKYICFHTTPRPQNCHSDNFEALLLYLRVIGCFTDTSSSDFAE